MDRLNLIFLIVNFLLQNYSSIHTHTHTHTKDFIFSDNFKGGSIPNFGGQSQDRNLETWDHEGEDMGTLGEIEEKGGEWDQFAVC
jgi:hypothetical protein